jgi:GT2 family glycosyltransferase
LYYEDFDFCRRYASHGHSVGLATELSVIHTPSSITDRNQRLKLQHSTYSYLLTLERYTNGLIAPLRLLRIFLVALVLLPANREAALGKLTGILLYLQRVVQREPPLSG